MERKWIAISLKTSQTATAHTNHALARVNAATVSVSTSEIGNCRHVCFRRQLREHLTGLTRILRDWLGRIRFSFFGVRKPGLRGTSMACALLSALTHSIRFVTSSPFWRKVVVGKELRR